MSAIKVKFWGVRGSIPAPLTPAQVEAKIRMVVGSLLARNDHEGLNNLSVDAIMERLPFDMRSTYGGNTTCVEVRCDDKLFILDLGTGARGLGAALAPEMFGNKGVYGIILQSHVHWDHIQGFPFFFPARAGRLDGVQNHFSFYGGSDWQANLEQVLRGQQNPPVFPVDFRELQAIGADMKFANVFDGWKGMFHIGDRVHVTARKLNHPQETYGYRIEYKGEVLAFTTDHEPYAGGLHRPLVDLVRDADIWITDCQYSHDEYIGAGGAVQKMGWGHSYPEYLAAVAAEAKPKRVVTFHHDPASSDERVEQLANAVLKGCGVPTIPAYEGLVLP